LHNLRIITGFAAALIAGTALVCAPSFTVAPAHAQKFAEARKKAAKKTPAPKATQKEQKEQQARPAFTPQDEASAAIPGIADARAWGDSASEFAKLLPQASGPWLAISGGGSDGAFGGGVLAGWTQTGTRPEFAVVSGVSIGALIAPFAFLGPRYDDAIRQNFTSIGAADIFEDRLTRDSLFDYWPLKRLIEQQVTPQLLSEIAAEHARGRRLYVTTTNLDSGRPMVWNMGAIAAKGDERALKLFRDVLLASSSIPGFFSPVGIAVEANGKRFEEMHGDGTLTAPFFVLPEAMLSAGAGGGGGAEGGATRALLSELYLIVNSKLEPEFKMPERNIPEVLGRAIAVALTSGLRAQIALISAAAPRAGIALHIAQVPGSFDHPSRGPFDGRYMQALYALGVDAGKQGTAFQQAALSPALRGGNSAQ
jgi:hypothetical protein